MDAQPKGQEESRVRGKAKDLEVQKQDRLSRLMKESKPGVESTGQDHYAGLRNSIWKLKWSNGEIPLFPRCRWVVFRFLNKSPDSSETPVAKSKVLTSLLSKFFRVVVPVAVIRLKFWRDLGYLHFERWSIALIQRYVKPCSVLATLILQRLFSSACAYIHTLGETQDLRVQLECTAQSPSLEPRRNVRQGLSY